MKNFPLSAAILVAAAFSACSGEQQPAENKNAYVYPKTRKVDTADTYFGVKVSDPYRWLEDDNSEETKAWVQEQNKVTFDYLGKIASRDKIRERLKKIWNFEKISAPYKKGKYYFYSRNDGIQNQSVLYVKEGLNGEARVLIDPNTFSQDGTVSLSGTSVSHDGKYIAYGLSKAGSDWVEYDVMEIATGKKLDDHLKWIKFAGLAWKGDGFYYCRFDAPKGKEFTAANEYQKVYFHKLGDPQEKDKLVYQDSAHANRNFGPQVSDDQRWLLLYSYESTSGNALMVQDLSKPGSGFKTIVDNFKNDYGVLDVQGSKLLVRTNAETNV